MSGSEHGTCLYAVTAVTTVSYPYRPAQNSTDEYGNVRDGDLHPTAASVTGCDWQVIAI